MTHVSPRSLNHTFEIVSLCHLFFFFFSSQQSASKAATCYMAAAPSQECASKMSMTVFHVQKMCLFRSLLPLMSCCYPGRDYISYINFCEDPSYHVFKTISRYFPTMS